MKLQSGQCTYSDLDCLLSFPVNSEFYSLADLKSTLNQLAKVLFICSSTLVYLALSTCAIVNTVLVMKTLLGQSVDVIVRGVNQKSPQIIQPSQSINNNHHGKENLDFDVLDLVVVPSSCLHFGQKQIESEKTWAKDWNHRRVKLNSTAYRKISILSDDYTTMLVPLNTRLHDPFDRGIFTTNNFVGVF